MDRILSELSWASLSVSQPLIDHFCRELVQKALILPNALEGTDKRERLVKR